MVDVPENLMTRRTHAGRAGLESGEGAENGGRNRGVDIFVHLSMWGESGSAKLISFSFHRLAGQKCPAPLLGLRFLIRLKIHI